MCDIMGTPVEKNRNYRHIVPIFFLLAHLFFVRTFFFPVAKWFRERNSFFIVRRFNSTNSIFHRPHCRGFNWAQGVSIFVECNMQSSDLSNQILVCCRPHSDVRRQTLDKFYTLLLHSCIVISFRIVVAFTANLMSRSILKFTHTSILISFAINFAIIYKISTN